MTRALSVRVTDDAMKQRRLVEAQVERWTTEAKKLADAGQQTDALELYRRAADELSGAPWLQHRTAELARKLKQHELSIHYFRRAATAFQLADFAKRAIAPLRSAWSLSVEGLPATSKPLVDIAVELMQLHRRLGFAADAMVIYERTNAALRARGFSEIPTHQVESTPARPAISAARTVSPVEDTSPSPSSDPAPASAAFDVAPAEPKLLSGSGHNASSRRRELAGILGRRG